jgi:maleate isomerase
MSTAIAQGWEWEDRLLDALSAMCGRATSANRAMLSALRHLGVRRIAVITPYPEVFNTALRAHFGARGIEITALAGVEVSDVRRVREVRAETLYQLGAALDLKTADAICILATDLETVSVIERLERHAARPVVSSNQALVWDVKRQLGIGEPVSGYGRLLGAAAGDIGADGRRRPSS